MRVNHFLLGMILTLGFSLSLYGQHRNCGSMEYLEQQMQADPNRAQRLRDIEEHTQHFINNPSNRAVTGTVTIPVVVHVVYNTTAENISDAQIQTQIDVLNADFRRLNADAANTPSMFLGVAADSEIEFCLATVDPSGNPTNGITRTSTTRTSFGTNDQMKFNSSGGKDAWPAGSYMNMWVCDISGGILGYAQFPGGSASTDGVVIDYQYFGTIGTATAPFDLGRTATHEVGHWLNLRHIWGDGGCTVDDFVSDTPVAGSANYTGYPCAFPGPNTCNSGAGDQPDMFQNYMDYSDDVCMNLYTQGQKTRMRALFDTGGFRQSLLNSTACGSAPTPTCNDGIQNQGETGVDCGGPCPACPPCNPNLVVITINLDNYPEETSWVLTNSGGSTVASGGTYGSQPDGSTVTIPVNLADGCYTFTINDSYGDGICCNYGNGSYSVASDCGTVYASGGSFGSSASTNFCIGSTTPTCSDGIQNQGETGVDCGGPCPACPTCNDGIQNQGETGVDCGGPCTACPTCNDGIQNQGETGIDCGGPCQPCSTGCTYTTINSNNFESSLGIWTDGGSDCARYNSATYANSGSYSVFLRDNTSTSVMSTSNLNLAAYTELTVSFSYITSSMDNANEDFWLQISTNGGSTYTTVEEWNRGDEFENLIRYNDVVVIPGPFTSTTRIRFRCDASDNNDLVFIDDVVITGCNGGAREGDVDEQISGDDLFRDVAPVSKMEVFPNPTQDVLNVTYTLPELAEAQLILTDLTGKTIQIQQLQPSAGKQQVQVQVDQMVPGIYFVHLVSKDVQLTKKFVIAR